LEGKFLSEKCELYTRKHSISYCIYGISRRKQIISRGNGFWRRSAGESRRDKIPKYVTGENIDLQNAILNYIYIKGTISVVWARLKNGSEQVARSSTGSGCHQERGRPSVGWMEGIQDVMSERRVERGQWMDREEWRLGMGRCQ
jgi:hypothetical protein